LIIDSQSVKADEIVENEYGFSRREAAVKIKLNDGYDTGKNQRAQMSCRG
jgi:hypothetical protein